MKKTLFTLLFSAALANATVIHWSIANDVAFLGDATAGDKIYTGLIDYVEYNNGTLSATDGLTGKFAAIDLNADMFYISNTNSPVSAGALITGKFDFDINLTNIGTASGYTVKNVVVNDNLSSQALTEFKNDILAYGPNASYTFSIQGLAGNGQLASVPEPTTMGLMGLGLLGLGLMAKRRRKA